MSKILKFTREESTMEIIPDKYSVSFLIEKNDKNQIFTSIRLDETDLIYLKGFLEIFMSECMENENRYK